MDNQITLIFGICLYVIGVEVRLALLMRRCSKLEDTIEAIYSISKKVIK